MTIGSSDFGLRGDFSFHISSQFFPATATTTAYYQFRLGGSASVKVRAFGITLAGVGLSFNFEVSGTGRVPITLEVRIEVDLFLFSISETARFTIGYLMLPRPIYLAGSQANGQLWGGDKLYLNVGSRSSYRDIAEADVDEPKDEGYLIEQVGVGTLRGVKIKVTAFGRSQVFDNVTSIEGRFGDGNDSVVIAPSVTIPVFLYGDAGNDVLTLEGSGDGSVLEGGDDIDYISSSTGGADVTMRGDGGTDMLVHIGGGKATMYGGADADRLVGSTDLDELYGDGGNDVLQGKALKYYGGAGADTIMLTINGKPGTGLVVDGGSSVDAVTGAKDIDSVIVTLSVVNDDVALSYAGGTIKAAINLGSVDIDNTEALHIDLGAGADKIKVGDLTGSQLSVISLDLGRIATVNGTRLVPYTLADGRTFNLEEPDVRYSDDRAADEVTVEGRASNGDTFAITTPTVGGLGTTRVSKSDTGSSWTVDITRAVRGEGDKLVLKTLGGNDVVNASAASLDLLALTVAAGTGNDIVQGTPFADVLDTGLGDDTVTGWDGRDTFIDEGGDDTIKEEFDRDFFLSDNLLVIGVAAKTPGASFTAGSIAEDLAQQFENAILIGGASGKTFFIGDADGALVVPAACARCSAGPATSRWPRWAATTWSWSPPASPPAPG